MIKGCIKDMNQVSVSQPDILMKHVFSSDVANLRYLSFPNYLVADIMSREIILNNEPHKIRWSIANDGYFSIKTP